MIGNWDYALAFSRNLGLVSPEEQDALRRACVAIAGLGGVGGVHLVTLARLGIGSFRLADLDSFESPNFNRQYGATVETVGRSKVEVMAEIVRRINPDVSLTLFPEGLTAENSRWFVDGADVVLDGIDFFAVDARRLLFRSARAAGLYALTSGPLGFGATLHVFSPTGMSFDQYFDLNDGMSRVDQLVAFAVGLAPKGLHLRYLDLSRVDFAREVGPSSVIACHLCSAIIGAETLNLLLGRSRPVVAPHYFQFDPYLRRYVKGCLRRGNRQLVQRLKRWHLKRRLVKEQPVVRLSAEERADDRMVKAKSP
ncbi:ThiF family adenylyltransferase [Candidatus Nitrospira bockiana]